MNCDITIKAGAAWPIAVCACASLFLLGVARSESNKDAPYQGAVIGKIEIVNNNVFDLTDPLEDKALFRFANTVHIKTRPNVIEQQLLFEEGDEFQRRILEETKRLLRKTRYIGEVEIKPVRLDDGVVDIEVRTTDDWTLKPSFSFGRAGGENSASVGLEEYNLFGLGTEIGIEYGSDVDRDTASLHYADNSFIDGRYQLAAAYSRNSDGFGRELRFAKPFFALDTLRAGGIAFRSGQQVESIYAYGKPVLEYEHAFERFEVYVGRSHGLQDGFARRLTTGIVIDDHEFSRTGNLPAPDGIDRHSRRFVYPFVGFDFVEDDYIEDRNIDQIGRTEDRHLGARLSARIGFAGRSFGSSSDAWFFRAGYADSLRLGQGSTMLYDVTVDGRVQNGIGKNMMLAISARYDRRQSEKRLFHARIRSQLGRNLDIENPIYLGGDNGLRGYPLRYLAGDKLMLLTLEQRLFTDWYPFRLFRIGAVAFFDAGRVWGEAPAGAGDAGWMRDVGIGLRIGNVRSSVGRVLHIDFAYPLDGPADISNVQLLIEAKRSF